MAKEAVKEATEKTVAVCAGMFPKTSLPFAKKLAEDMKQKEIPGAEVQQAMDPNYVRVAIPAKDQAEAEKILEAMKKAGFSGFTFEI